MTTTTAILDRTAPLCIGTKRGKNYGVVFDGDGTTLGKVTRTQRRLRDTGGGTGTAYTAVLTDVDGTTIGYLGTRHEDRWSAARAIRAFWQQYPPAIIAASIRPEDTRWCALPEGAERDLYAYRRAAARLSGYFKYDQYETCGLTARYRGGDPRRHEA